MKNLNRVIHNFEYALWKLMRIKVSTTPYVRVRAVVNHRSWSAPTESGARVRFAIQEELDEKN